MKQTKNLMGMHVTVNIVDSHVHQKDIDTIFRYFTSVDERFSTYKPTSEISQINAGKIKRNESSKDMQTIFSLAEQTKQQTNGYFNIVHNGKIDPSGIVKGWAIWQATKILKKKGFNNFFVDAGGDVQVSGEHAKGKPWRVGIQNPFSRNELIKVLTLHNHGIATSGTAIRGNHIYNPHSMQPTMHDIVSLTVIGPNVYEADRFATAAFAMGKKGIGIIETLAGFEGYMVDTQGIATYTSGLQELVAVDEGESDTIFLS